MAANGYFDHPRPEMRTYIPPGASRILDIGCGTGAFAASLKEQSACEVWGIEIDSRAALIANARLDNVLTGDALDQLPALPDHHFDCIVLNDVLEHLVDPERLLEGLVCKLSSTGRVVASIPNARHFHHLWEVVVKGRWEYADEGILDRTHLRFFTKSSLGGLFERTGWDLQRIVGIHATGSLKFKLTNLLTCGRCSDMRYLQFVCVAVPRVAPGAEEEE